MKKPTKADALRLAAAELDRSGGSTRAWDRASDFLRRADTEYGARTVDKAIRAVARDLRAQARKLERKERKP